MCDQLVGLPVCSVSASPGVPAYLPTLVCSVVCLVQIEAVWLQDFASRMPGYPDLGPCIVIKGSKPCCGLLPAVHMTDNHHIAIPLRTMSKVSGL